MVKRNVYLFLLGIILLSAIISAEAVVISQDLGTHKISTPLELIQVCSNDTSICDSCNISTVKYPNSSILIQAVQMTKRTSELDFNHTLNNSQINTVGEHIASGYCTSGTQFMIWRYTFTVTRSGEDLTTAQAILYFLALITSLFIFCLTLWGSLTIQWGHMRNADETIVSVNDWRFAKIFLIAMTYVLLTFIFGVVFKITSNFLFLDTASAMFEWMYWVMLSLMYPLIVLVFIISFVIFLNKKKMRDALERGAILR